VQPWLAAQALNARRTTSTMRWLVSTFPAHTAAVRLGASRLPPGMLTAARIPQPRILALERITAYW
jgi:hypothetical protein